MSDAEGSRCTVHCVFTTHWDREWVQSFEQYRFRLGRLMDRVLAILAAEPDLCFVTDGQTAMVADYLDLCPERAAELGALIRAGRVVCGPWLVLADQFLEGDEATVRNLLLGRAQTLAWGGEPMGVGYVPDSFGSIAALPTILAGFGIRFATVGRGIPGALPRHRRFRWRGPDGSSVEVLPEGYGGAIRLAYPAIDRNLAWHHQHAEGVVEWGREWLAERRERAPEACDHYASVGADHMELRPEMSTLLAALNERTDAQWISSTPEACCRALAVTPPSDHWQGELRGDAERPMTLQGVLATDAALKRRNRESEWRVQWLLEPLALLRRLAGVTDTAAVVRRAWSHLLLNHAHDSICGCSTDAVMADVHARLRQVDELTTIASERWAQELVPLSRPEVDDPVRIHLFDPLPGRGLLVLDHLVRVPGLIHPGRILVHDEAGETVGAAEVVAHRRSDLETTAATDGDLLAVTSKAPAFTRDPAECETFVRLRGRVDRDDRAGWIPLHLVHVPVWTPPPLESDARRMRNGLIEWGLSEDGSMWLTDLASGESWNGLGWFEDRADLGDTYDHIPMLGDRPLDSRAHATTSARVVAVDAWRAEVAVETRWQLPVAAESGTARQVRSPSFTAPRARPGRRSPQTVECVLTSRCILRAGVPWVEVVVDFENRSDHHLLRVGCSGGAGAAVHTGGHFGCQRRDWLDDDDSPYRCRPLLDWVHRGDGLGIVLDGIYAVEARRRPDAYDLLFPVLRSVDTIGPAAGMDFEVEHARARGPQQARYWLMPATDPAAVARAAAAIRAPSLAIGRRGADAPSLCSFGRCANPRLRVTAIKRAEDDRGAIVRLLNLGSEPEDPMLTWFLPHAQPQVVNLDETPLEAPMQVPPHGLLSVRFPDADG